MGGMSGNQYIQTKDELSSILEIGEQMIDAMIHMHNEMKLAYFDWNLDNLGVTEVSGKPFVKVFDYDRCRDLDDNTRKTDVQQFWSFIRRHRHTHGLGTRITEAIEQYWNRETLKELKENSAEYLQKHFQKFKTYLTDRDVGARWTECYKCRSHTKGRGWWWFTACGHCIRKANKLGVAPIAGICPYSGG